MRLLVLALSACAARSPAPSSPAPSPSSGVAPSIWRAQSMDDAGDGCEPWWFAPAVYCDDGEHRTPMVYSGCEWRCPSSWQ